MFIFINMVIARIKNGSPDMSPTAFEGKNDENKMRYLPGFIDLIYFKLFSIGDGRIDKKHKNGAKFDHMGSPRARILHAP